MLPSPQKKCFPMKLEQRVLRALKDPKLLLSGILGCFDRGNGWCDRWRGILFPLHQEMLIPMSLWYWLGRFGSPLPCLPYTRVASSWQGHFCWSELLSQSSENPPFLIIIMPSTISSIDQNSIFVTIFLDLQLAFYFDPWYSGSSTSKQGPQRHKGLTRPLSSMLPQLRTGKIGLNAYLSSIQQAETSDCDACDTGERQDPAHILLTCPALRDFREQMWATASRRVTNLRTLLGEPGRPRMRLVWRCGRRASWMPCNSLLSWTRRNPPSRVPSRRREPTAEEGCNYQKRWACPILREEGVIGGRPCTQAHVWEDFR